MSAQQISLYYKEGTSDKVYHVQLEPAGSGFVVNFQYGRRGGTLQTGTKTASPVTRDKGQSIYDKLVAEKTGKGYTEGESGTPYSGTEMESRLSGLVPQLLNPVNETALPALLDSRAWAMQEKKDGVRLLVRADGGRAEGSNRKGMTVAVADTIRTGVLALLGTGRAVLDGESIGDHYWVFDLLEIDGADIRHESFETRYLRLQELCGASDGNAFLHLVPIASKPWVKRDIFERLQQERAEGVVFKRLDASYVPGRPASGGTQLKHKFTQSVTCVVLAAAKDRRSVQLALPCKGVQYFVGNVTIPPNFDVPRAGALVEVRYLYAYPNGSLYQPVYLGQRFDLDKPDGYESLKLRQGSEDDV